MNLETFIALAGLGFTVLGGIVSYVASRAGSSAAVKVHLEYLRRDVDHCSRSVRAAHWRLDEIQAPPAPSVIR